MKGDFDFKEVIKPPLWLLAFVGIMLISIVIAVWAAFNNTAALFTSFICLFLEVLFYITNIHRLEISQGELRIDRAHIPLMFIESPQLVDKKDFLLERTRLLDPAAFAAIIYWVSEGVKVTVNDERDPTPYWLISSRKGIELIAAIARNKEEG
jgi:hypothetical protein